MNMKIHLSCEFAGICPQLLTYHQRTLDIFPTKIGGCDPMVTRGQFAFDGPAAFQVIYQGAYKGGVGRKTISLDVISNGR